MIEPSSAIPKTTEIRSGGGVPGLRSQAVLLPQAAWRLLMAAVVAAGGISLMTITVSTADAQSVSEQALMRPGPLPDLVYGDPNAKITIVEYASMTCIHCANFHNSVLPKLKREYINSGKAKLVFREFPLDSLAAGASMLARCAGRGSTAKSLKMNDVLFARQRAWAFSQSNPLPALFRIAKAAGFTQKTFDACLKKKGLFAKLNQQRSRAAKEFGVRSTPTFFINGKRLNASSFAAFEKAISAQ